MTGNKGITRKVAYGGILLALSVLTVFMAGVIPGAELTIYAVSTLFVMVMVFETTARAGWIFYIASCLLVFLLIPNKLSLFPYATFFGPFGLIKYHIEALGKRYLELALKLLYLNITFGLGFSLFGELILGPITLPDYPLLMIAVAIQPVFLIYDRLLTLLLDYYRRRFRVS